MPQNYTSLRTLPELKWAVVLLLFLGFLACTQEEPTGERILDMGTMARVISKIHLAEATLQKGHRFYPELTPTDETWVRYGQIFRDEELDWPTWQRSLEYYTAHPRKLKKVYEMTATYIDKLENELARDSLGIETQP